MIETQPEIQDLSDVIYACRKELHRINLTWKSLFVLEYCYGATGHRDAHYLTAEQLRFLLIKLQSESTPLKLTDLDEIEEEF